jgi:hypothetical protein
MLTCCNTAIALAAMAAMSAILPLSHSERCQSARHRERGTPRMFVLPIRIRAFFQIARVEQAFMAALKMICNPGFSP